MPLDNAYIPYGGYWSSPFCRWQGSLGQTGSIELAASTAQRFLGSREIDDVVVTFLAVLELVRLRLIRVWQTEAYGAIRVAAVPSGDESEGEGAAGTESAAEGGQARPFEAKKQ